VHPGRSHCIVSNHFCKFTNQSFGLFVSFQAFLTLYPFAPTTTTTPTSELERVTTATA
jgi:hypothetical protein